MGEQPQKVVQENFSTTTGPIVFVWPGGVSQDELDDVMDWLRLIQRKLVKSAADDESGSRSLDELRSEFGHIFDEAMPAPSFAELSSAAQDAAANPVDVIRSAIKRAGGQVDEELRQECCEANSCCAGCGCDLDQLNPSEALYGFMGWLTSRQGSLTIGSQHDVPPIPELVGEFIEANSLPDLRLDWNERLVHPDEDDQAEKCKQEQEVKLHQEVEATKAARREEWSKKISQTVEQDGVCPTCGAELLQTNEVTARCSNDHVFMVPAGERERLAEFKEKIEARSGQMVAEAEAVKRMSDDSPSPEAVQACREFIREKGCQVYSPGPDGETCQNCGQTNCPASVGDFRGEAELPQQVPPFQSILDGSRREIHYDPTTQSATLKALDDGEVELPDVEIKLSPLDRISITKDALDEIDQDQQTYERQMQELQAELMGLHYDANAEVCTSHQEVAEAEDRQALVAEDRETIKDQIRSLCRCWLYGRASRDGELHCGNCGRVIDADRISDHQGRIKVAAALQQLEAVEHERREASV